MVMLKLFDHISLICLRQKAEVKYVTYVCDQLFLKIIHD